MRAIENGWRPTLVRWLKFNTVGGIGIVVQLAVLAGLNSGLHLGYLLATALAVEAAVIHNFLWHEHFTWRDRTGKGMPRLIRFNLTTGMLSVAGNLVAMELLVGMFAWPCLAANGLAIIACSVVNFVVSDRVVFSQVSPRALGAKLTR